MPVNTIVVGVDGSEGSKAALRWAGDLAHQVAGSVIAVHAYHPLAHLGDLPPPVDFSVLRDATEKSLAEEWCKPLADLGVAFEAVLAEGDPTDVIVEAARDHDAELIVVGARGLSTFRGLLLGSTSLKIPHVAERPVVIVPHSDR